jgi:hypothetical protein
MSIKFICSCGKHLRARDDMAARRSMCPRCGAPVGVPSLQPTHAGTLAAPMTPQERRRLHREKSPDPLDPEPAVPITTTLPPPAPSNIAAAPLPWRVPRVRRRLHMEEHWYQCLLYPFLNRRLLLALALPLTLLSGGFVLSIPELPRFDEIVSMPQWPYFVPFLLVPLLFVVYTCATVECALTSALAGEGLGTYWPSRSIVAVLKSGLRWLLCFLAGPIVPLALAGYFWLYGGDLTALDWAIVVELIVLAAAYWLLAVVCSVERDRLRDANPVRVAQLVHRLRFRAVVPVLIAPVLMGAHAAVAFFALAELHQHASALLLLACCWGSGLFSIAALFRLLGVWCYHLPACGGVRDRRPASVAAAS